MKTEIAISCFAIGWAFCLTMSGLLSWVGTLSLWVMAGTVTVSRLHIYLLEGRK